MLITYQLQNMEDMTRNYLNNYLHCMLTLCASRKSDARCQILSSLSLPFRLVLTLPCSVLA